MHLLLIFFISIVLFVFWLYIFMIIYIYKEPLSSDDSNIQWTSVKNVFLFL